MEALEPFDEEPCSESFLKKYDPENTTNWRAYRKYRLPDRELVYYRDSADRQHLVHLQKLHEENLEMLDRLNYSSFQEAEAQMKRYLNQLHKYNEVKDVAQALLGHLALLRQTTTKSLYREFDLDLSD